MIRGSCDGIFDAMTSTIRVTIDAAGRIVVPKPVREAMGLRAGSVLEMTLEDGILNFALPSLMRLDRGADGVLVFTAPEDAPILTDEEVQAALDEIRR